MKKLLVILLCLPMIFSCRDKTGCILGDCENGYGTYTYASGSKYVGEYKDGNRHGQGTYTWQNPWEQYIGEYKYGEKNGQGTNLLENGDKYVGEYKNANKFFFDILSPK